MTQVTLLNLTACHIELHFRRLSCERGELICHENASLEFDGPLHDTALQGLSKPKRKSIGKSGFGSAE